MNKQCAECRDGEHPNYDDAVRMVKITDPDTGKQVKCCNMCNEHQLMYLSDGYGVE